MTEVGEVGRERKEGAAAELMAKNHAAEIVRWDRGLLLPVGVSGSELSARNRLRKLRTMGELPVIGWDTTKTGSH